MDESNLFLNYDGLDDHQARYLRSLLCPSNPDSHIEFPWNDCAMKEIPIPKGHVSSLNIHAPVFQSFVSECKYSSVELEPVNHPQDVYYNGSQNSSSGNAYHYPLGGTKSHPPVADEKQSNASSPTAYNGHGSSAAQPAKVSSFKLNPTVSSFVPLNFSPAVNGLKKPVEEVAQKTDAAAVPEKVTVEAPSEKQEPTKVEVAPKSEDNAKSSAPQSGLRSWADIVSSGQKPAEKVPVLKNENENNKKPIKMPSKEQGDVNSSVEEDKMALALGKHLYDAKLNFAPLLLQPRGLINRRNWCYINATLQALLACAPFYTLVRNLPLGPAVERGKSSTPVIDSMVKLTYEFTQFELAQEEIQTGTPFQPDFIYDMLKDLKSDCLKGQQEDAEEFLSFILNGMHEEMVKIIKNYEKKNNLELAGELKENGDLSDGEDEWTVIGSKHRGMVTRKVAEHKTPISELLGGQIKSFLTISGSKTSASIQPFFTLQLDIQSENVNSVSDALREMTVKEPIQGYTCAKTKQEVEAYSHIALQKLPPILILHLKRFIYNKTGCKKVMKKTDYPLVLELSKDMMSSDLRKNQKIRKYKLFAVMYHDGEEAVKGHYICDSFSHGCKSWIRCDDRAVTSVSEDEVLSHSPPRVPYLLFYQEC